MKRSPGLRLGVASLLLRAYWSRPLVVTGDISVDWLAWPLPAERTPPEQRKPDTWAANWRQRDGTRMAARRGGALLLADLLRAATARPVISPHLDDLERQSPEDCLHSLVDLEPRPLENEDDALTFRVARLRGFSRPEERHPATPPLDGSAKGAALLVFDNSANGFRQTQAAWKGLLDDTRPDWLIVKMSHPFPLATDPMWKAVHRGPLGGDGEPDPERLIVILNADDLREEGIALSRPLSWERTAEDFVRELGSNGRLDTLATCANLIVRFDCDGVIHHRGRGPEQPMLYFDPAHGEGEFVNSQGGRMMGMTATFTAALAAALVGDPSRDLGAAIRRGMSAARRLAAAGFHADQKKAPVYPHAFAMMGEPDAAIVGMSIPSRRIAAGEAWSILHDTLGDPAEAARRVVGQGPEAALARVPVARFGNLHSADRREIESFRAIANLLREYMDGKPTKPISIGVFGPPGAGKSFGVEEVAKHVAQGRKPEKLEFNLSQFTSLEDLIAAFHLVRDRALSGGVPLVFFDEFDSPFNGEQLGWLRYFLAPMQDGKFRERGHAHPLGAAIFVFAGGTRSTFAEFAAPMALPKDHEDRLAFAAVKGPDFASRLRGHVDIMGPDPVDGKDRTYPVRRAFLLRSLAARDAPQLLTGGRLNIDAGVLNAMLTVPAYRHGVRSMEAMFAMSALAGETQFKRAALPPAEQLELHVDAAAFMARVKGERLDDKSRERLGRFLHDVYRKERQVIVEKEAERAELATDKVMMNWRDLEEEFRESSRLQADHIPYKLRLIDCFMAMEIEGRDPVEAFEPEEIEQLAEREHERFNAERLQRQWRLGERDPSKHASPFLIPWSDLEEKWRRLDRSAVLAIPRALATVGWRVYRVG